MKSCAKRLLAVLAVAASGLALTVLVLLVAASPAVAQDSQAPVDGLLLRLRPQISQNAPGLLQHYGLLPRRYYPQIDVWWVDPPAGRLGTDAAAVQEVVRLLLADPAVLWADANGFASASEVTPNDPFYLVNQANLGAIGLPVAWQLAKGLVPGITVTIAILDTGVGLLHPDLVQKLWLNPGEVPANQLDDDNNGFVDDVHGRSFVGPSTIPFDDHNAGHGTHVAGIAGAQTNNALGIAGISWGARLMPVKVLNSSGLGSWADIAAGILYAADNGAQVLNLSLGGDNASQVLAEAVIYAQSQGCLLVAAVGNENGAVDYPARLPGVLGVTAVTNNGTRWSNGNFGPLVDLSAPGVNIYSTVSDVVRDELGNVISVTNSYDFNTGTSMAAPHASGVAALVWSLNPGLSAAQVTNILTDTARDLHVPGFDVYTGWGMLDAAAAVQLAAPGKAYIPIVLR